MNARSKERLLSPGPSDYTIDRSLNWPSYHIWTKKTNDDKLVIPGPSDYNYDPMVSLKKQARVIIGNAKKVSCLVPRDKSPGPSCYNPKRI